VVAVPFNFVEAARLSLVLRDSRLKIIILDDLDIGDGARLSVGVNRLIRWIITSRKRAQRQSFGCHRCEKPPVLAAGQKFWAAELKPSERRR
jgi:hypothetical protein